MIGPTTTDTSRDRDAVVIGAGPGGSIASRELARRGLDVLLVDKAAFPRFKVCGCCLNGAAIATLDRLGLGQVLDTLRAAPIRSLSVVSRRGTRATLPLAGGRAVSRDRLDTALIESAIAAGADFIPSCTATVGTIDGEFRIVHLSNGAVRARMVIVADGLAGTCLSRLEGFEPRIARRSRVGIGALINNPPAAFDRGAITMICGRHAYLGAVWVEENRLDMAAAVDPKWLKDIGGPQAAIDHVLREAGINADIRSAWRGTPSLTRRRRVEASRLIVIGDAAGYVEPFTGEGMAWAMESAEAAAGYTTMLLTRESPVPSGSLAHAGRNIPETWTSVHHRLVGQRQRECRWIARFLRHSAAASAAIRVLALRPSLASPIVSRINQGRGTCAASGGIA